MVRLNIIAEAHKSWRDLNEHVGSLNEDEVKELLRRERARVHPRQSHIRRLIQRLNAVRTDSVRVDIK